MVTKKIKNIPLLSLIPLNFSKKSLSTNLLSSIFQDINEKEISSKHLKQIPIKISFLVSLIEQNKMGLAKQATNQVTYWIVFTVGTTREGRTGTTMRVCTTTYLVL